MALPVMQELAIVKCHHSQARDYRAFYIMTMVEPVNHCLIQSVISIKQAPNRQWWKKKPALKRCMDSIGPIKMALFKCNLR